MNIPFTPELEQFIASQITSGKYTCAEEVIIAGIELLEKRERIYKGRFEELKREIMIGVEASQRGEVIDVILTISGRLLLLIRLIACPKLNVTIANNSKYGIFC